MDDVKEKDLKQEVNQKKEEKPKKENNQKSQIIVSVFMLTATLFAGEYVMVKGNIPLTMGVVAAALVSAYVLTNAILRYQEIKEAKREEHFENLHKSQKASYIILKKNFDELEDKFRELQELSNVQTEDIINAQKGVSKASISRSKQNADAVIASNEKLSEKLNGLEEIYNTKIVSFSEEQEKKLSNMEIQAEEKIQSLITMLKDMELRLNQVIVDRTEAVMSAPVAQESLIEVPLESESIIGLESRGDFEAILADKLSIEESVKELKAVIEESEPTPEPVVEEEKPAMPDMSDPNKMMSPDDIAALLANMNNEPEPEPVAEEEKPPMPDMSDPNKMMSPDDIAALLANMNNEPEPEPEPVVEEKPPMPDLSDPNKMMSPEDIAALLANL